jgi:hypothetical protein
MPPPSFDLLCTPERVSEGRLRCVLPEGWKQGRGLFGGLVTALMVRALEAQAPGRPLRSLTSELCGPLQAGEVSVRVETLREGNAVTTCAVRLEQGGQVQAHGVAVLGKARVTDRDSVHLERPALAPWSTVEVVPVEPPFGPEFAPFFEFRAARYFPLSGEKEPRTEGWVRLKDAGPTRDAAFLAACIDSWWPALFTIEETMRPMATVAFTFQPFVHFEGLDPASPLFFRGKLVAASDGYCVELRELWGEDGRLLALNQQTFVIIK